MPIIGNNGQSLLHGLSDFWLRFFKDLGDLEATYEATAILMGQTYLNLLSDVLNTSIDDTPLFKKEYYKLITIREDQVVFFDGGSVDKQSYAAGTAALYGKLPYLQNKVFEPTAGFEEVLDYTLNAQVIEFKVDPTDPVPNGFANRDLDVVIAGTFNGGIDWVAAGVKKGDVLVVNKHYAVNAPSAEPLGTLRYTVVKVATDKIYLKAGTALPETLSGFSWRIERLMTTGAMKPGMPSQAAFTGAFTATTNMRVREIALWAVDALVDDARLYHVYGHHFGAQRPSSETYRAFIRGLMQLYVFGPIVDRIESALNVMAALPVIRDDGEVLTGYDNGLDDNGADGSVSGDTFTSPSASFASTDVGGYITIPDALNASNIGIFKITAVLSATSVTVDADPTFVVEGGLTWEYSRTDEQTVTTSQQTYTFPRRIPMREDVVDPANFNVLTFRGFEALTTATVVTDYIKDPEWWLNITLPKTILDRQTAVDRTASPQLLPNVIGPTSEWSIGDPGFYISASDDGEPTGYAQVESPPISLPYILGVPLTFIVTYGQTGSTVTDTCVIPPGPYLSVDQIVAVFQNPVNWLSGVLPAVQFQKNIVGGIRVWTEQTGPDVELTISGTSGLGFPGATALGFIGFHHRAAFILMDRFLKTHILAVIIDKNVDLTGALIQDMQKVLLDLKPAESTLFFQPITEFIDVLTISEDVLDVTPKIALVPDQFVDEGNQLLVGSSWVIGDGWQFTGATGGAITIGSGAGFVFATVGGADPGINPSRAANEPIAYYIDRALYVNPRPP